MSIIDGGNASTVFDFSGLEIIDIAKDVQYYLQSSPEVQSVVKEPLIGVDDAWVNGWIFDSKLSVRQENTQRCAIVVSYGGGWSSPLDGSTASFPVVVVDIWADPTRSADNSILKDDAKTKCFTVHAAVKRALHLAHHEANSGEAPIYFNQTRVTSSELLGEPELSPVSEGNGAYMLRCRYGISTF
jgi:hypothetical protein